MNNETNTDPIRNHPAVLAAEAKQAELKQLRQKCAAAIADTRAELTNYERELNEAAEQAARASLLGEPAAEDARAYAKLDSTKRKLEALERESRNLDRDIAYAKSDSQVATTQAQREHEDSVRAAAQALIPELFALLDKIAATGAVGTIHMNGQEYVQVEAGLSTTGLTTLKLQRHCGSVAWCPVARIARVTR